MVYLVRRTRVKMMHLFSTSILLLGLVAGAIASGSWTYTNLSAWNLLANTKCNGKIQSPIAIVDSEAQTNATLGTFTKNHFIPNPISNTVINNGHSLQVNVGGGYMINDRKLLPGVYWPAQFHFHWALQGSRSGGSEHTLNGKQYFAEMHIVHNNNNTKNNQLNEKNGIAVLGFFIQADAISNNTAFDKLLHLAKKVKYTGESAIVNTPLPVSDFLPKDLTMFYRYSGSLTTPLCNEVVVWSVFKTPISISNSQKQEWQSILYYNNTETGQQYLIGDNFRPTQNLNGRIVTKPGNKSPDFNQQSKIKFLLITMIPIATLLF